MHKIPTIAITTLALYIGAVQSDTGNTDSQPLAGKPEVNQKLELKFKMASDLLDRIKSSDRYLNSDDPIARNLFSRAEQNIQETRQFLDEQKWLEAGAVIEFVLRDITTASKLLKKDDKAREEYSQSLKKLDSFALPEWGELSEQETGLLRREEDRIRELRARALDNAQSARFQESTRLLKLAYQIKVGLLTQLEHEKEVIYDHNFSTEEDEYRFMLERNHHFMELIELARSKRDVNEQTNQMINAYIYEAVLDIELATQLETEADYTKAISLLSKSVKNLLSVLKILGVRV